MSEGWCRYSLYVSSSLGTEGVLKSSNGKKNLTAEVKTPSGDTLPPIDLEGVCDCRPRGATCYTLLEGAFCCSGRCTNEAKCA